MKKRIVALLLIAAGTGLLFAAASPAATYKYTDKKGNVGLADDLSTVPEEYRATAVLIGGEAKEETAPAGTPAGPAGQTGSVIQPQPAQPAPASAPASVPAPSPAPVRQEQGMSFSIRLAISIAVVVATIFVSVFLGKVSAMHGHDRAIHILRVSLSWLVVVYLIAAHVKDVVNIFKTAGGQVQSVSDEAAKKGEKAAAFIKAMDAAAEQAAKQSQENEKTMKEADEAAGK